MSLIRKSSDTIELAKNPPDDHNWEGWLKGREGFLMKAYCQCWQGGGPFKCVLQSQGPLALGQVSRLVSLLDRILFLQSWVVVATDREWLASNQQDGPWISGHLESVSSSLPLCLVPKLFFVKILSCPMSALMSISLVILWNTVTDGQGLCLTQGLCPLYHFLQQPIELVCVCVFESERSQLVSHTDSHRHLFS